MFFHREVPCITILNKNVYYKIGELVLLGVGAVLVAVGGGRMCGKGVEARIWCNCSVHMYVNGKMRPIETIPGMEGGGNKGE
jgi:hypothetical protein